MVCSNIGLGYLNKNQSDLRFGNSKASYDKQVHIIGDGVTSYTFKNVIKVPSKQMADISIEGTR